MPIPDELLDYLAEKYYRSCIDPSRLPFYKWAAVEAEKLGWKI